ncbi:LuxR C-terminal-related transcriptional regulator [Blastococcus brunescens]|uniref:LuxR C-terminal-related transcriptional regulator n=1 Tax=Blastococcus brunescens TaxID=1564165 RepID=A0ABZ1AZQ4_9ACTN|nr:LuxR C-terminal-related transcriptional regulator [Blastococcus sp. BMG 8361]WRL64029.1 LuxR C-terminal-related transcriptional regulator [Blastococcus sp. BMG 8361]
MAFGATNGEIAERFVVSEATVKTHVGRVLAKTGPATACRPSSSPTGPAWCSRPTSCATPSRRADARSTSGASSASCGPSTSSTCRTPELCRALRHPASHRPRAPCRSGLHPWTRARQRSPALLGCVVTPGDGRR